MNSLFFPATKKNTAKMLAVILAAIILIFTLPITEAFAAESAALTDGAALFPETKEAEPAIVDKTNLVNLINAVSGYDKNDYEPTSWAAFEEVLEAAAAVRDLEGATQEEVNDAVTALSSARDALIFAVYKDSLSLLVQIAQSQDVSNMKPGRVQTLEDAISGAQAALEDTASTQDDINLALYALSTALINLQEIVNRDALIQLISSVEEYDESKYTTISWGNLQAAFENAKSAAEDLDNFEEDISAAQNFLLTAISQLVTRANKASLLSVITIARGIVDNWEEYIPSTVEGLSDLLSQAEKIFEQDDAAQQDVNEITNVLITTCANTRVKADKRELAFLIGQARSVDDSSYTAQSIQLLSLELKKAQNAMNDEEITQTDVESLVSSLSFALANLVEAPSAPAEEEEDTDDDSGSGQGSGKDNNGSSSSESDDGDVVIEDEETPAVSAPESSIPSTGTNGGISFAFVIVTVSVLGIFGSLHIFKSKRVCIKKK